jgi:hypothetical protein
MITFRIKFTLPLLVAVLLAVLVWLIRNTNGPAQRPTRPPRRPPRRAHQTIIPRSERPGSYDDALRNGITGDELQHIADRELAEAAQTAYESADDPAITAAQERIRAWRPS